MKSWFSICIVSLLFILNSAFGKESHNLGIKKVSDLILQIERDFYSFHYKSSRSNDIGFSNYTPYNILTSSEYDYIPEEAKPPRGLFRGGCLVGVAEFVGGFSGTYVGGGVGGVAGEELFGLEWSILGFVIGGSFGSAGAVYLIGNSLTEKRGSFTTTFLSTVIVGSIPLLLSLIGCPNSPDYWECIGFTVIFSDIILIPLTSTIAYNLSIR